MTDDRADRQDARADRQDVRGDRQDVRGDAFDVRLDRQVTITAGRLYALLGVVVLLAITVAVFAITSQTAADRADGAESFARQIQEQREFTIRSSCEETNRRHDQVLVELDEAIAALEPPSRRERAEANRPSTVALLEALAPYRDCDAVVRRATQDR